MAIAVETTVQQSQLWPQRDARDPLGIWGFRQGVTGNASGGSIKVTAQVPAARSQAYVYTLYDINVGALTTDFTLYEVKCRLLTNWPNIDVVAGVQAYGSNTIRPLRTDGDFTAPITALDGQIVGPNQRFLLLFNFQSRALPMDIVELEMGGNVDTATYTFEGYGYFWDRGVMNAPGGLRHPGSS